MKVKIREAKIEDYDSLLPLFREVHEFHVFRRPDLYIENPVPVEREEFISQIDDHKQHVFVAHEGAEMYAFVVMSEEEVTANSFVKARKVLVVNSLGVSGDHRGKGIGKMMMEFALEYGKKLEVDSVELGVSESNQSAIRFYEAVGLTTKSRKMEFRFFREDKD